MAVARQTQGGEAAGRRQSASRARRLLLCAGALLGWVGLDLDPGLAAAAEPHPALQRANQLITDGKLDEACAALQEAYAQTHEPMLQLRLGRLYTRLEQAAAARAAFQRFLDEEAAPHPALREEAQRALRTLPAPAVAAPAAAPTLLPQTFATSPQIVVRGLAVRPVTFADRRSPRLWKLGAALFFGAYVPTLVAAAAMAPSLDSPSAPSRAAVYSLMVPALGPVISAVSAPASRQGPPYGPTLVGWSVPWLLTSGLLQAAGLTVMILGATPRRTATLELAPQPGAVMLSGRF